MPWKWMAWKVNAALLYDGDSPLMPSHTGRVRFLPNSNAANPKYSNYIRQHYHHELTIDMYL